MIEAVVLGSGIMVFLCAYMFFQLGKSTGGKHMALQILLLGLIVAGVFVLGGSTYKAANCDLVFTNSTTEDNVTEYNHDYVCRDEPFDIGTTFLEVTQWFGRLMLTYVILYFIYEMFRFAGKDLLEMAKRKFR